MALGRSAPMLTSASPGRGGGDGAGAGRAQRVANSAAPTLVDPSVMLAMQPIYTARPWFRGCDDPVPIWGRVALLDGYEDVLVPELPRLSNTNPHIE